ncbi:bacteriochlorophyll synthase [beta proteobacterium AAP121]|nr:bacteriochlorophyll synthase [beta proteobacterium AAP65]KPF97238.1 bacteriochlorophyll synthase [beta proteobacterium AAP121]
MSTQAHLGWAGIVRLGLVQAMLGAVVVLTTSTLNRVMVVELALPALLPGLLVALHYAVQLSRPRMGYGSDVGGRRTPWILGGIAVLALGGFGAAVATTWMNTARGPGIVLAVLSFALVGVGVSAGGTSLLVLLAKRVDAPRRASAAALVWVMMIVGFAVTAGLAGRFLDPYTPARLMAVSGTVSLVAVVVAALALWGLEGHGRAAPAAQKARPDFMAALREVWREPDARRFTIFVFVSMLAYSTQDLILEPFAGAVFGFTPGASTQLSGVQHGGTLMGMLLAALAGRRVAGARLGSLRAWTVGGCIASGLALLGLVVAGSVAPNWPLRANVFILGVANGAFSIAAIGSMMSLAGGATATGEAREGTRMGLWGAAQAIGFAVGGLFGAAASDVARWLIGDMGTAYAAVFALEAGMFVAAALLAARIGGPLLGAAPATRPASAAPLVGPADTQALRAGGS